MKGFGWVKEYWVVVKNSKLNEGQKYIQKLYKLIVYYLKGIGWSK